MSDPAIEAAQKVLVPWSEDGEPEGAEGYLAEAAAREMAKSVQELHKPETKYAFPDNTPWTCCSECGGEWPCETAKRVYPSEELGL